LPCYAFPEPGWSFHFPVALYVRFLVPPMPPEAVRVFHCPPEDDREVSRRRFFFLCVVVARFLSDRLSSLCVFIMLGVLQLSLEIFPLFLPKKVWLGVCSPLPGGAWAVCGSPRSDHESACARGRSRQASPQYLFAWIRSLSLV